MHLRLKMMLASWSAFSCALALCNTATLAQTALPQVDVTVASPIRAARRHGLRRSRPLHSPRRLSRRQSLPQIHWSGQFQSSPINLPPLRSCQTMNCAAMALRPSAIYCLKSRA